MKLEDVLDVVLAIGWIFMTHLLVSPILFNICGFRSCS